jgi:hypothetical protein
MPVPPIYQPEIPAEAVYWAAHHHRRELWVGYSSVLAILGNTLAPSFADRYLGKSGFSGQQISDMPVSAERPDNLFEPVPNAATHGMFDDQAKVRSPQLWATTHRAVVGGGDPRQRAAGQPARQDSLDEPRLAGRDRAGCRDAPRPARVCATGRR